MIFWLFQFRFSFFSELLVFFLNYFASLQIKVRVDSEKKNLIFNQEKRSFFNLWNQLRNWKFCFVPKSDGNFKIACFSINKISFMKTVKVYECQENNKKRIKLSLNYFQIATVVMEHNITTHMHLYAVCVHHRNFLAFAMRVHPFVCEFTNNVHCASY